MLNPEVCVLRDEMEKAINEIVAFGKAKMSEIQERKRRLTKIREDLGDRNEMGQLDMFDRSVSLTPEIEDILEDPTRGW